MPLHLRCVLKAAPRKSLRAHKIGIQVPLCVPQINGRMASEGRGILALCLNFWAIILCLILQIQKGICGGGREELSTFSVENISAKHFSALPNLTQSLKQRLWLCLAAQFPSVPSEVPILLQDGRMTKPNLITVTVVNYKLVPNNHTKNQDIAANSSFFSLSLFFLCGL